MALTIRSANAALVLFTLLALPAMPARASLFSLAASGTISFNNSSDSTIPIGTPWTFELTYDTAAPDLDFQVSGSSDPTFGRFTNTAVPPAPPALDFFHYRAGGYEVTLDHPADFGKFSAIDITFIGNVNAIDINIQAPTLFPHLAGGPVSFHADFNAFSTPPIFSSDALPTNTALGPGSFDQSSVTLLPPAGVVTGSSLTSLTLTATLRGDFNRDGHVTAADVPAMLNALADLNSYQSAVSLTNANLLSIGDINSDGKVTNADLPALLTLLKSGGGSAVSVPEPTSVVLLALAFPGLAIAVVRRLGS